MIRTENWRHAMKRSQGPAQQDLPPKSPAKIKGGGRSYNDNITLLRAS